jgi:pimeloyl-ACP methyl ester carboxylesterase
MSNTQSQPETLVVGLGAAARPIAVLRRPGTAPGIFWLGGYRSEMTGSKAEALDALGARMGAAVTRFDYSGHGQSGGAFLDGTISRWLEEAEAVFGTTSGPQVIVGSSMGGWIALAANGRVDQPSEYSTEPYPITAALIEDGRRHLLFGRPIETGCPVTILQGGKDPDVPRAHAQRLVEHLLLDPVTLTIVPDGDHRLSRPQDLQLLERVVVRALA